MYIKCIIYFPKISFHSKHFFFIFVSLNKLCSQETSSWQMEQHVEKSKSLILVCPRSWMMTAMVQMNGSNFPRGRHILVSVLLKIPKLSRSVPSLFKRVYFHVPLRLLWCDKGTDMKSLELRLLAPALFSLPVLTVNIRKLEEKFGTSDYQPEIPNVRFCESCSVMLE